MSLRNFFIELFCRLFIELIHPDDYRTLTQFNLFD